MRALLFALLLTLSLPGFAGRQASVALAQNRQLDIGLVRAAGGSGLGGVIAPEIVTADGVGFGQTITERRLGQREFLAQPLNMADRPRRPARGDVGQ